MKLNKVTFAAMAVLALVAQPFYAVIASQSASASGLTVVTPAAPQGWVASSTNGGSVAFASGDSTVGLGALKLTTSSDNESYAKMTRSENMLLSELTQLSYETKQLSAADTVNGNAMMRINIDTDGNGTLDDQLMYEPYYNGFNGTTMTGWQSWSVKEGKFWSNYEATYNGLGGVAAGSYASNFTLSDVMHDYPTAKVLGIVLGMGTWNPSQIVLVDNVAINDTQYDFDPTPYVPTTPPTRPSLSGEVIFDSMPTVLPSNSPSLGYEATSTHALGDKITFAGEGRELDDVAVTLSSWACESGSWNNGTCVTTPGATFTHPITLNIYNVAEDGTVGSLIASRTQTFAIPYRPTSDPTCGSSTQWRDTNGNCFNGLNHVVVFDAAGITVPETIIYSVAYNTQHYGESPIGVAGPYSSLNVSLSSSTNVGTNNDADELFWDTTYPGYTSGLKADSGWGESGNPAVVFTAKKADTVDEDDTSDTSGGATTNSGNGEVPRTGGSGALTADNSAVVAVNVTSTTSTTPTQASEVLGTDEATGESLSAQDSKAQKEWSLVNLILSAIVAVMAVITLAGVRGTEGSAKWLRFAAIIPAIAAIVILLIVEDFSAKLALVNAWTLLFVVIAAVQAGLVFAAKKPSEE